MLAFLQLVLLALATVSVLWSGWRFSSLLECDYASAVVATAVVAVAIATLEPLILGLAGLGSDPWALTAAALATAAVATRVTPAPRFPARGQLPLKELSPAGYAALGAAAAGIVLWGTWLVIHPTLAVDAVRYHLGEPTLWLQNGRPGSWTATLWNLPDQADPKNFEVLVAWILALARTPVPIVPLMLMLFVLTGLATMIGLRHLGVSLRLAVLLGVALAGVPYVGLEVAIETNDMVALCWLVCAGALAAGTARYPRLTAPALIAAGLAAGTKPTTVPLLALLVAAIAWSQWSRRASGAGYAAIGVVIGGFFAVVWPLQTWVHEGAPFYPWSSLPTGVHLPVGLRYYSARFLSHPLTAIRAGSPKGYAEALGGGLVLLLGLAVPFVVLARKRPSPASRAFLLATSATVVALLVWAVSPETGFDGLSSDRHMVVGTGVRFLLPTLAAATLAWGLASRGNARLQAVAALAAGLAIAADLLAWSVSRTYPFRPGLALLFPVVAAGALLGLVGRAAPNRFPLSHHRRSAIAVACLAVLAGLGASVGGYVAREIPIGLQLGLPAEQGLAYLSTQRMWDTHPAPVMVGPAFNALLAGPRFSHVVHYVGVKTPCAALASSSRDSWIVLTDYPASPTAPAFDKTRCLRHMRPVFRSGSTSVYRPIN